MPGPFAITPSSSTVPLDAKRTGTVTFTVQNTTRMRIRGVARLVATPPESAAWHSIIVPPVDPSPTQPPTTPPPPTSPAPVDPLIRDFAPEGTQTFTVQTTLPATAAPGEYKYRLVVANEANPDDEFTEGAEVGFSVAPPPPPKPPRKFPIWIIPVILVVLAVIIVAFLLLRPQPEPDPIPTEAPEPTITETSTPTATATATATPTNTATPTVIPTLNSGLQPDVRFFALSRNFSPDPNTQAVPAGRTAGPVNVAGVADACVGFTTVAPTFTFSYTSTGLSRPLLRFYFVSDSGVDTVMVIQRSSFSCNDTSFGTIHPSLDFNLASSGTFQIWIGAKTPGASITGTLFVTNLAVNQPPTPVGRPPVFGIGTQPFIPIITLDPGFLILLPTPTP